MRILKSPSVVLACLGAAHVHAAVSPMEETRSIWKEWSQVKALVSQERAEWERERQAIADTIAVSQQEVAALSARLEALNDSSSGTEKQRSDLLEGIARSKEEQGVVAGAIGKLEAAARELLPVLPDHLRADLGPLVQRLPAADKPTETPLSQRMQTVIALAAQLDKFHSSPSLVSEIKDVGGGKSVEVKTLYFGFGVAYYSDAAGTHVGFGRPGPTGWVWNAVEGSDAARIGEAIRVHLGEKPPAFVTVPATLASR